MKAGYVALFGLVIAYSAYQGSGESNPGPTQLALGRSSASANVMKAAPAGTTPSEAKPFPTISAGICRLTVKNLNGPCGECKAICPAKGLTGLIEDYFRAEPRNNPEYLQYLRQHWYVPHAKQPKIKFVIASLPDPVHTHMALLFDRGIETIQIAAQANGYLFSRAWMPWDISTHNESTDFTVRMAQADFRDQAESLPGLMIFQKSDDDLSHTDSILFVFVVGETPTGGLHIEQFQNTLHIRESILAGSDSNPEAGDAKLLRIYGPTFSGSLSSLDDVLNAQPHDHFSTILIRSGSISSYRAMHEFCESTRKQWPDAGDSGVKLEHKGRPDFATFQFSDQYQEFYLSVFFNDRHELHSHVAVLSEDETAFGNQERVQKADGTEQKSSGVLDPCPAQPAQPVIPLMRLYFPREIAQLRDAYQRDVKIQSATDSAKNPPQNGLALSLSVTGNEDDSVAPYSPLQTPLSQESILLGIVATLRMQHAKVVIIRAADPLDTIFLSRYLRENYPQARLVTVGADLLMVHDFYDPRFHGILAVTPYPILTGADFPARADPASVRKPYDGTRPEIERLFPDSYSVGAFNAFQSLLAPIPETESQNLPVAGYAQFGLPSFLQPNDGLWRPRLWLTTVGRDSYWPVAILDDVSTDSLRQIEKDKEKEIEKHTHQKVSIEIRKPESSIRAVYTQPEPPSPYSVHFSIGWTICWVLTFGLTCFLAYLLTFPRNLSRSEVLGRFGGSPSRSRNCLLITASLLLLAAQMLFVFPAVIWLVHFWHWSDWRDIADGLLLVALGYLISVVSLGAACGKGFRDREAPTLARAGIIVCATTIVVTLLFTWYMAWEPVGSRLGAFVYRYIHVDSGVSPSLPLFFLLAGWIWWCWQSLTGVMSTEEKHMVLPDASDFTEARVPGASDRVRLKALAANEKTWPWETLGPVPFEKKIAICAFAGLAVILFLMWPSEIAEAFEWQNYKRMYWTLLYFCLLLVCFLISHIVALWLQFRTLLRSIERTPFRRGFSDLKSLTWKPLWELAGNGRQEFVQLLGGEVDALTQIQNGEWLNAGLAKAIDDAKDATNKLAAEYGRVGVPGTSEKISSEVPRLFHNLQNKLAKAASEALIYANQQWKQEVFVPPFIPSNGKDAPAEPPAADPTMRAIEHFLCLFYVNIILVPLRRLQTLILALAGVFVFVLISYSSYPFESRESFHVLLISIFFVISLVVGIVYGQMYANPLLSRITNTKPGELGLDFWVRLGTFVFIPLLSLLSVQFPEINNFLFSWLQPALQSIK